MGIGERASGQVGLLARHSEVSKFDSRGSRLSSCMGLGASLEVCLLGESASGLGDSGINHLTQPLAFASVAYPRIVSQEPFSVVSLLWSQEKLLPSGKEDILSAWDPCS